MLFNSQQKSQPYGCADVLLYKLFNHLIFQGKVKVIVFFLFSFYIFNTNP